MASKELKVYRTEFICEVQEMHFKVKFPCSLKLIWKRSNESSHTSLVPVQKGIAHFHETLKLNANMYFDETQNKFVEKKSLFSFLIVTDKGEKSAGSITFDLGDFLNKRTYEIDQVFSLNKCPLPDANIKMKIYYNDSSQKGSDTMSQISSIEPVLDDSLSVLEVSTIETNQHVNPPKTQSQPLESLIQSDIQEESNSTFQSGPNSTITNLKMSENIQSLNKITLKIDETVKKFSSNFKSQIFDRRQQNQLLQQKLCSEKLQKDKLENQFLQLKQKLKESDQLFEKFKEEKFLQIEKQKQISNDLRVQIEQNKIFCESLEKKLSETGDNHDNSITDFKVSFEKRQNQLKLEVKELKQHLICEKSDKASLQIKLSQTQHELLEIKSKYSSTLELIRNHEQRESTREKELDNLRVSLENAYDNVLESLASVSF